MKRVSETKAGKAISAWIVLNPNGKHVATVRAHYSQGMYGTNILLNVFNMDGTEMQEKRDRYVCDVMRHITIDGIKLTSGTWRELEDVGYRVIQAI